MRTSGRRGWRFGAALAVALMFSPALARAQGQPYDPSIFTAHAWSQIVPNYGYLNACQTGYRAFVFTDDGYFVFDRRVHGSWRETARGTLLLLTRSGFTRSQALELLFDGKNTLTPNVPTNTEAQPVNPPNGIFAFRRYDRFQLCPP